MPLLFFERAFLAPKHTEVTISTSLTSFVIWPFDSPYAISYRHSVVTEVVSPAILDIMGPKHFGGHDVDLSRSRDVIDHVTNRFPIGHLLLVVHWYQVSISKRFRDLRVQKPVHTHRQKHAASDFIFCPMARQQEQSRSDSTPTLLLFYKVVEWNVM